MGEMGLFGSLQLLSRTAPSIPFPSSAEIVYRACQLWNAFARCKALPCCMRQLRDAVIDGLAAGSASV